MNSNKSVIKSREGFTLIELIAVIIILAILLIIAIPAVSTYLDNSKYNTYISTAKEIISGARNMVNKGELEVFDIDTTYYIPSSCIDTEGAKVSPFGEFEPAYVIVNYDDNGFSYYWMSADTEGFGFSTPTLIDELTIDKMEDGLKASDIKTNRSIGTRSFSYIFNKNCTGGKKIGSCSAIPIDFNYTGNVQKYTINCAGKYRIEAWGAEGGYRNSANYSGRGGYSYGTVTLKNNDVLNIYVGGSGNTGGGAGGFNGGGKRNNLPGGGGASDVRINSESLYARVIVAGGGGSDGATSKGGGYGGGYTAGDTTATNYGTGGYGGTRFGNTYSNSTYITSSPSNVVTTYSTSSSQTDFYGGFGFGGNGLSYLGYPSSTTGQGGAGGGGWFGGTGTVPDGSVDDDKGGGGGSGYVYTSSSAYDYPSGCLLNEAYYMIDAETIAGNIPFPAPGGATEVGHTGNGFVRLTYIDES